MGNNSQKIMLNVGETNILTGEKNSDTLKMVTTCDAIENQSMQSPVSAVYRVSDIAAILSISDREAYYLCNKTVDFRVVRIGKSIRIVKQSFDDWLAGNCG